MKIFGLIKCYLKEMSNILKSKFRLGNYWYWLKDSQYDELDIKNLIYPFRYDILIRKNFFSFYVDNRDLYLNDQSAFVEKVKSHEYYDWFIKVAIPKASLSLRNNPDEIEQAFVRRIKKSVALYDNIEKHGFDKSSPIIPRTAKVVLPTITGKTVDQKYYMGDGCHRLACLMSMGYEKIPKEYCRIKCYREFTPRDNTSLLMQSMSSTINWPDEYGASGLL